MGEMRRVRVRTAAPATISREPRPGSGRCSRIRFSMGWRMSVCRIGHHRGDRKIGGGEDRRGATHADAVQRDRAESPALEQSHGRRHVLALGGAEGGPCRVRCPVATEIELEHVVPGAEPWDEEGQPGQAVPREPWSRITAARVSRSAGMSQPSRVTPSSVVKRTASWGGPARWAGPAFRRARRPHGGPASPLAASRRPRGSRDSPPSRPRTGHRERRGIRGAGTPRRGSAFVSRTGERGSDPARQLGDLHRHDPRLASDAARVRKTSRYWICIVFSSTPLAAPKIVVSAVP